jgi:predicted RND superfamily exporter protein
VPAEQRHLLADQPLAPALVAAANRAGEGLGLAALALCAGFLSFYPTSYRGVAELGMVAAAGMAIAVLISLTTLPALLLFTRPRPEPDSVGYAAWRRSTASSRAARGRRCSWPPLSRRARWPACRCSASTPTR